MFCSIRFGLLRLIFAKKSFAASYLADLGSSSLRNTPLYVQIAALLSHSCLIRSNPARLRRAHRLTQHRRKLINLPGWGSLVIKKTGTLWRGASIALSEALTCKAAPSWGWPTATFLREGLRSRGPTWTWAIENEEKWVSDRYSVITRDGDQEIPVTL